MLTCITGRQDFLDSSFEGIQIHICRADNLRQVVGCGKFLHVKLDIGIRIFYVDYPMLVE